MTRRPFILIGLDAIGLAWLATEPLAWRYVAEFWADATSTPTYGWLIAACIVYALVLKVLRHFRFYDRYLAGVVLGGIVIVGLFVAWRFTLPAPANLHWAWRVMVYHFYAASLPIFIWQMADDWREHREAQTFRAGGNAP